MPTVIGQKRGAELDFDRRAFARALSQVPDGPIEIRVRKAPSKRSQDQNRWLWGVAYAKYLGPELGYDKHEQEEMHYWLVKECFGIHWDERQHDFVPNARSSRLTTKEFSEFMKWLIRYAAQKFHCRIPLPNEVDLSSVDEWEAA